MLVMELLDSVEYRAYSHKNAEIVLDLCVSQCVNPSFGDQQAVIWYVPMQEVSELLVCA